MQQEKRPYIEVTAEVGAPGHRKGFRRKFFWAHKFRHRAISVVVGKLWLQGHKDNYTIKVKEGWI